MFTGYVSLGNNFYCYLRKPLRCRGPGQLPSLPPPLNPALVRGVLEAKPEVEVWRQPDLLTRYDTRCYFNVRSKADMNRLNLPHGGDN